MLRPLVALGALCAVVLVLAPTVASVSSQIEALHIKRDNVWHLWKWYDVPPPVDVPPQCQKDTHLLDPLVTLYSTRLAKDEPYTIGGVVTSPTASGAMPIAGDRVEVYLNITKNATGGYLGEGVTDAQGQWEITGRLPFALQANHYHIVAHALDTQIDCINYHEGWSDPEVNVTARTSLTLTGPYNVVAGRSVNISGALLDDVGGPVVGQTVRVQVDGAALGATTDASGHFTLNVTPIHGGKSPVLATFTGNAYYSEASATTTLTLLDESVTLNGSFPNSTLRVLRSTPTAVDGQVILRPNSTYAPVRIHAAGLLLSGCETCAPTSDLTVDVDGSGAFHVTLLIAKDQPPGSYALTVSGGGLRGTEPFVLRVMIPTILALQAHDAGLGSHNWTASLTLSDDLGPLVGAPVVVVGPGSETDGLTGALGNFGANGNAGACGPAAVNAQYNGTDLRMPAQSQSQVQVCGALLAEAHVAQGIPWWVWVLIACVALAAWIAWRRWRARHADFIAAGPPLTLAFDEPRDAAQGVVGLGEVATLAAFLEAPMPPGFRLRMGTPARMEDVETTGLEARYALVADAYGEVPVRAELLDARGHVVTRRTRILRVVKYAEEIERRYKALRSLHGADARVSPRAFEAWLAARSAGLDPAIARRLVGIFEEADYGPRIATRAELLAYLEAETAIPQEVDALAHA